MKLRQYTNIVSIIPTPGIGGSVGCDVCMAADIAGTIGLVPGGANGSAVIIIIFGGGCVKDV